MKKFNDTTVRIFALLITSLSLLSCSNDDDNYPKEYVGFEHNTRTIKCDKNKDESEYQIKIIAVKKSDEDRTVLLSTPSLPAEHAQVLQLTEKKIIIKAGKKSATTTIKYYPKRMILDQQNVTLSCVPQWKDGAVSKLSIRLERN